VYLYNNFCYANESAVADAIASTVQLANGGLILGVTSPAVAQVEIEFDLAGTITTHTVDLVECDRLGFNQSFFGITEADALDLAWLGIGVLVVAWGITQLRAVMR